MLDEQGYEVGVQKGKLLDCSVAKDKNIWEEPVFNGLTATLGKKFDEDLSDGTKVILNWGTHLSCPIAISKRGDGNVRIMGEAYFGVDKDSARPFVESFQDDLNIGVSGA